MSCPSCAAPLANGARFCSSCGRAVAPAAAEERRIVTVLFADVVGFTTLAEHRDPESVKRLADGLFARLAAVVTEFGGRVDKLLGDGMLVLFGAPVAHEDDAERAVRAALRLHEAVGVYAEQQGVDPALQLRVGINTGEVLVGTLAGTDYTAMGDVVNTASRLQAAAPPGGVLVGEATYALTADVVRYDEPTLLQPRGRDQSVTTWLALDTVAPPGFRLRRTDLRLVGREAELAVVRSLLRLVRTERRAALVHVGGESGVGKTRFVSEVLACLDEVGLDGALVLEGACVPYGESNVWAPIAAALTAHLGLDPGMPTDEVREHAGRRAALLLGEASGGETELLVEVFTHLLGHPSRLDRLDPAVRRERIHRGISRVVEVRAARGPMVLWIDDLHWADQVVLDLLADLVVRVSRQPFVLITSMRPGGEVEWPPVADRTTALSMALEPLSRAASDELARELLGTATPETTDDRQLAALFERSGGNPLFLQEWAAVVADERSSGDLPDSLRALIAARLDQLSAAERQLLDNAAVLGLSGSVTGLERFAAALHQTFDRAVLRQLDAIGLLRVEALRWRFRSDSVREAVYQTLTKASRAQRHAGVAASYLASGVGGADDLAHHAATAAELVAEIGAVPGVPSDVRVQAIGFLAQASEQARANGSNRLVVRHTGRAIGLLDERDPAEVLRLDQVRLERATALIELRDYARARADIDAVLIRATDAADAPMEGVALRLLGTLHHLAGDQSAARRELGNSIDVLRQVGDDALLAEALRQRGFIELFGGSPRDAEWFFGEAEAAYQRLGDERGLAYVEQHRAWLTFLSGDLDLADERLHRAADTLGRLGDRNGVGWAFGLLAFVRFYRGQIADAEDLATLVRSEAVERGDDWAAAMMQALVANIRLWQGRLADALHEAEQARARFRRLGDSFGMGQALAALLRVQVALGRRAAAQRTAEEVLSLSALPAAGPVPLLAAAGAAMHRGDGEAVLRLVSALLAGDDTITPARSEALLLTVVGAAQVHRLDDAFTALDLLGEPTRRSGFACAAAAILHVLATAPDAALRDAAAVIDAPGATYFDRTLAAVGAGAALAQLGRPDEASARIDQALVEVLPIGDVVATALLQLTASAVVGRPHDSGEGDRNALGSGWLRVLDDLARSEVAR